jgi:hypothetical protein
LFGSAKGTKMAKKNHRTAVQTGMIESWSAQACSCRISSAREFTSLFPLLHSLPASCAANKMSPRGGMMHRISRNMTSSGNSDNK